MLTSQRILGSLTVALVLASGVAYGGDLSNVTVGRFQDFTVVTLFGEGALSVTHQIVEAKDGKPHRIVVDVTGALHRLPQNNYMELPEGSITAIRTSQFAVSPEPVVRVVLDLAHPAAYRLESPEGEVRLLVSLPGDPAMASTWSAREGALPATGHTEQTVLAEAEPATEAATSSEPAQTTQEFAVADPALATAAAPEQAAHADASPAAPEAADQSATESTSENATDAGAGEATEQTSSPSEAQPAAPASTQPSASPAADGEVKALPLAPAGALAADEANLNNAPTSDATEATSQSAWDAAAPSEGAVATALTASGTDNHAAGEHTSPATESATAGLAADHQAESNASASAEPQHADAAAQPTASSQEPWKSEEQAPEVPLPDPSKAQPERVIDYNLPVPATLAATDASTTEKASAESEIESAPDPAAPKLAVKSAAEGVADPLASTELPTVTGTDAAATDVGSAPVASLSTLPPIMESAEALVPERQQIIYHTHGKRDPFKALLTAGGYSAAALPDVTTLRLVGVLQDVMESWGLFEDANGYGYILRKGDRVKNGNLTQLTTNRAYFNLTEFGWSRSVHIDLEPEG